MASIAATPSVATSLVAAAPAAAVASFSASSSLRMPLSANAVVPLRLRSRARPGVVMSVPEEAVAEIEKISELIDKAVHEAEDACKGDDQGECVAKWEEVEELSAARAHKKVQIESQKDPLEKFCDSNPEADECRTYED